MGVAKYENRSLDLRYANQDAQALHAFYRRHLGGAVPEDHFVLLTDSQATRAGVLSALKETFQRAFEDDLIVVSMSMHGLPDDAGELYFVAHDTDVANLIATGIAESDVLRLLERTRARRIVLLLDACHAGGFGQKGTLVGLKSVDAAQVNLLLSGLGRARTGVAVLSSSSAAERSQESPKFGGGHGVFTWCLLGGLTGAADGDRDGLVGLRELNDHTYRCVKEATRGAQNPLITGRFDDRLPLAYTAEFDPARLPPAPSGTETGPGEPDGGEEADDPEEEAHAGGDGPETDATALQAYDPLEDLAEPLGVELGLLGGTFLEGPLALDRTMGGWLAEAAFHLIVPAFRPARWLRVEAPGGLVAGFGMYPGGADGDERLKRFVLGCDLGARVRLGTGAGLALSASWSPALVLDEAWKEHAAPAGWRVAAGFFVLRGVSVVFEYRDVRWGDGPEGELRTALGGLVWWSV